MHCVYSVPQGFACLYKNYCNSLLLGLPDSQMHRLQKIHNTAARILTSTRKYEHITPVLYELHWLPVKERIIFKTLILVHKCLFGCAPTYLKNLLTPLNHQRDDLRSANAMTLKVPFTRSSHVKESTFAHAAPALWNTLPLDLRNEENFGNFKANLKTFLFSKAYYNYMTFL